MVAARHFAISARQSTCVRGVGETFPSGLGIGLSNECSQPISPDLSGWGLLDSTLMHRTTSLFIKHHEPFRHTGHGFAFVTRTQLFILEC